VARVGKELARRSELDHFSLPQHRDEPFRAVPTEHPLEIAARCGEVSTTVQQDPLKLADPGLGGAAFMRR
jgi:hypothetical protein